MKKNVAGRNSSGKITVHHKGGGHKKKFRKIDFLRNTDSTGIVTSLEYDPYRTAFIASVYDFLNRKYCLQTDLRKDSGHEYRYQRHNLMETHCG